MLNSILQAPLARTLDRPSARTALGHFGLAPEPGQAATLAELCGAAHLDKYLVAACVEALEVAPCPEPERDWGEAPIADHIEHLLRHHHAYLRRAMPALGMLLDRLTLADAVFTPLRWRFHAFWQAMAVHLDIEEVLVFGTLERLARAPVVADARALAGTLARMAVDHGTVDGHLAALVALARVLPPGGPAGQDVLVTALDWLAADTARHVAEEEQGLFIRGRLMAAAALA